MGCRVEGLGFRARVFGSGVSGFQSLFFADATYAVVLLHVFLRLVIGIPCVFAVAIQTVLSGLLNGSP